MPRLSNRPVEPHVTEHVRFHQREKDTCRMNIRQDSITIRSLTKEECHNPPRDQMPPAQPVLRVCDGRFHLGTDSVISSEVASHPILGYTQRTQPRAPK